MRNVLLYSAPLLPLAAMQVYWTPSLSLEWSVHGTPRAGEALPVDLWLHNSGRRGVWVLPALDGSSRGLRFPDVAVYSLDGQTSERFWFAGCGNTNPLTGADFVWLGPGERVQVDAAWSVPPLNTAWETLPAGSHTLQATYNTTPYRRGFGDGGFSPLRVPLWKLLSLPWGTITSAPLTLTVSP